jgi:signal transduction histidine kinase
LINIGAISRPVDLKSFLYEPATVVGHDSSWQISALLAAAGALALSVSASLLWRRRFQLNTSATAASITIRGLLGRLTGDLQLGLKAGVARWHAIASDALKRLRMAMSRSAVSKKGAAPIPSPTDLNVTLGLLERSLRRRLPGSIDCRFSPLPELWPCQVDAYAVGKAVSDLVVAAVSDMPGCGEVIIGTRQYAIDDAGAVELAAGAVGDYVRLTVKDNGSGFSAESLKNIFDPVVTVRPAVAAARELVFRLGGFARVESLEGIGTAVHLYFRRAGLAADKSVQQPCEGDEKPQAAAA